MVDLSLWLVVLNVCKTEVYLDIFSQVVLDTCDVTPSEGINTSALPNWSHHYHI